MTTTTTSRPTATLTHIHTFHPDANTAYETAARDEKRLTTTLAGLPADDTTTRLSQASRRTELTQQLEQARARMRAAQETIASGAVVLTFTALTRGAYRALLAAHAPRPDIPEDTKIGANSDTFGEALITACLTSTSNPLTGKPVPSQWDTWAQEMTDGQWWQIFETVLRLNRRGDTELARLVPPLRAS